MKNGKTFPVTNLFALRKQHKLSQAKVAEIAGCSDRSYRNYERAITPQIDIDCLSKLCNYYNVSADFLLNRTTYRKTENESLCELLDMPEKAVDQLRWICHNKEMSDIKDTLAFILASGEADRLFAACRLFLFPMHVLFFGQEIPNYAAYKNKYGDIEGEHIEIVHDHCMKEIKRALLTIEQKK